MVAVLSPTLSLDSLGAVPSKHSSTMQTNNGTLARKHQLMAAEALRFLHSLFAIHAQSTSNVLQLIYPSLQKSSEVSSKGT